MNVSLKNVKVCNFASHETACFEASLYIDGKRVGTVSNDGRGGPNMYGFSDRNVERAFFAFCKAQPTLDTEYGKMDMDADLYVGELLEKEMQLKEFKRWCRKMTVFRLPGDKKGEYRTVKAVFSPKVKAWVVNKYPAAEILNEMI